MELRLLGAVATAVAVFSALMALVPSRAAPQAAIGHRVRGWYQGRLETAAANLGQARIDLRPQRYLLISVAAPLIVATLGLTLSAPIALGGAIVGAFLPRFYVRRLVGAEARAAGEDAPRVLRAMVNRALAGGTYPDLFGAAAEAARHRWVRADFEELLGRYYAGEPLGEAIAAIRPHQAGRNLVLVFDALAVLVATHQPASAAGAILGTLGESARSNQAIARSAAAEGRGLRLQAVILAIVIPGLFLYMVLANRALVGPVLETPVGRLVLLPVAALLEVGGILLSWRVTQLEA